MAGEYHHHDHRQPDRCDPELRFTLGCGCRQLSPSPRRRAPSTGRATKWKRRRHVHAVFQRARGRRERRRDVAQGNRVSSPAAFARAPMETGRRREAHRHRALDVDGRPRQRATAQITRTQRGRRQLRRRRRPRGPWRVRPATRRRPRQPGWVGAPRPTRAAATRAAGVLPSRGGQANQGGGNQGAARAAAARAARAGHQGGWGSARPMTNPRSEFELISLLMVSGHKPSSRGQIKSIERSSGPPGHLGSRSAEKSPSRVSKARSHQEGEHHDG